MKNGQNQSTYRFGASSFILCNTYENYFKCKVISCQCRRVVSVSLRGEIESRYLSEHTHGATPNLEVEALSLHEIAVCCARVQQFECGGETYNGYGEVVRPFAELSQPFQISRSMPSQIALVDSQSGPTLGSDLEAKVRIGFLQIAQLDRFALASLYDYFKFRRSAQKKSAVSEIIYYRCPVAGCRCRKQIYFDVGRQEVVVQYNYAHSHGPSQLFDSDAFFAHFQKQYFRDAHGDLILHPHMDDEADEDHLLTLESRDRFDKR